MTLPKIEEWIKEVENRPGSALGILKLIAGRLRDLTERNEELLAENIALQDGTRVEEYRKRIAHLEYQLDLLKRRYGLDGEALTELPPEPAGVTPISLLAYNARGRVLRIKISPERPVLGHLMGELAAAGELPRLLAVPEQEELFLLYTSGRVSTCTVGDIPALETGGTWVWDQGALPDEPHAGEHLACLMPLSRLPLADYFLQTSRRGCVKKTMTSVSETVFDTHYLGKGALQKTDQAFDLSLCQKKDCFALVTHQGRLLGLNVDDLSYSVEERIKLDPTDHVVVGFVVGPQDELLCLTQNGKVIHKEAGFLESAKASSTRGQALIPSARVEQGVRFIGAAPLREMDRVAVLDAAGQLTLHAKADLTAAGSIPVETTLVAFGIVPGVDGKQSKP
jgi:hypothetical protein